MPTKDNVNLTKQLSNGFKIPVYWNSYQAIPAKVIDKRTYVYDLLSASFQGVRRLFVFAHVIASGATNNKACIKNNRKYFVTNGEIKKYNILIDGRISMINQLMI